MFKYLEITDIKQGGKMKKFFVGLLSIFLLVGASILSACGSEKPVLTLSQQSVEIELYSGDVDGGYETVTAEVSNASDTSISVSANGSKDWHDPTSQEWSGEFYGLKAMPLCFVIG